MSSQSLAFALESNVEEVLGVVGRDLTSSTAVCIIVSMALVLLFIRNLIPCAPTGKKLGVITLSAAVCVIWSLKTEFPTPLPLPFSLIEAGADYAWQDHLFKSLSEARKSFPVEATYRSDKEMVLVLIIGEAARSDHFHINGYPRQTTPRIEQLGMLSFRDVTACGDSTRVSVPCMLTRATSRDLGPTFREPSLISVFKKAGFHTAWISNQRVRGDNDTPVTVIAKEASSLHFGNPRGDFTHVKLLDEDLLPALSEAINHPAPRKLIVLHTVGSHWFYEQHYSDDFRKFTPACERKEPRRCTIRELVSSYDNTIAYTDHFIASVVERVAGLRSLVVYVSDHGESLGEYGRFSHGHGKEYPEQMKVPMLVWASGEFSSTDPGKVVALARNTDGPTSHDILFHSLIDCAGIASPMVDGNMSVCR
jgi:glucan phosphoethanolaminetransferase (alkaline phosphatase superfamily)